MRRALVALGVTILLAAVVALGLLAIDIEDPWLGGHLTVKASPGQTPEDGLPIVSRYTAGDDVALSLRLCPRGKLLPDGDVPAALWAATESPDWRIVDADWGWATDGPCRTAALTHPAGDLWPSARPGVVHWAIVVGERSSTPVSDARPDRAWREAGLPVVDGEAILLSSP